jgi:hypothetical protein
MKEVSRDAFPARSVHGQRRDSAGLERGSTPFKIKIGGCSEPNLDSIGQNSNRAAARLPAGAGSRAG